MIPREGKLTPLLYPSIFSFLSANLDVADFRPDLSIENTKIDASLILEIYDGVNSRQLWSSFTKKCASKTLVFHVFVYKQQLVSFSAATVEPNEIWMLQCRDHAYLVNEFTVALP